MEGIVEAFMKNVVYGCNFEIARASDAANVRTEKMATKKKVADEFVSKKAVVDYVTDACGVKEHVNFNATYREKAKGVANIYGVYNCVDSQAIKIDVVGSLEFSRGER